MKSNSKSVLASASDICSLLILSNKLDKQSTFSNIPFDVVSLIVHLIARNDWHWDPNHAYTHQKFEISLDGLEAKTTSDKLAAFLGTLLVYPLPRVNVLL